MQFKIKIGSAGTEVLTTGFDIKDAWKNAALFDSLPRTCGKCQSGDLRLDYRDPGGSRFFSLRCGGCGYELPIRERKPPSNDLYFKEGDWQPPYDPAAQPQQQQPQGYQGYQQPPSQGNPYIQPQQAAYQQPPMQPPMQQPQQPNLSQPMPQQPVVGSGFE